MALIKNFQESEAWIRARELAGRIYQLTGAGEFARDFGLRDQLRRASVSIMSNIAEGFERGGKKEFGRFLKIAKGSTGEVRSLLYISRDVQYVSEDDFCSLHALTIQTSKIIAGLIRSLNK
jgi:four helix bundle protein